MFSQKIPPIVKYRALGIAKANAPVDTGNLRHNAIYLTNVKLSSFSILYDGNRADYLDIVNERQHYIDRTVSIIGGSIMEYYNTGSKGFKDGGAKFNAIAKQAQNEALSTAKNNPEREWRLYQSIFKSKGSNYKWR